LATARRLRYDAASSLVHIRFEVAGLSYSARPHFRLAVSALMMLIIAGALPGCAGKKKKVKAVKPAWSTGPGPKQVANQFFDSIRRGLPQEANKLVAHFPNLPPNVTVPLLMGMSDQSRSGQMSWDVMSSRVESDTAVVVVLERRTRQQRGFAVDPVYLVRQRGRWRILPKMKQYDRPYFKFNTYQLAGFKRLETWFNQGKAALLKELG